MAASSAFATGVAAGLGLSGMSSRGHFAAVQGLCTAAAVALAVCTGVAGGKAPRGSWNRQGSPGHLPAGKSISRTAATFAALFFAGMLCALMQGMIPPVDGLSAAGAALRKAGLRMSEIIGSQKYRDPRTAGLLQAIITGDRSALDRDVASAFRSAGGAHLLALSGMHLGIIYMIFSRMVSLAGRRPWQRKATSALMILLCGCYTLAAGAADSLTRAFIFICLRETASVLHRRTDDASILASALLIHLCLKPSALLSAGFQLSYAAMAGIVLLYPFLKGFFPENDMALPRRIWNLCALSIACQCFTAPIAWLRFGSFPRYFLIVNIIAAPLMTVLMGTGLAILAFGAAGGVPKILIHAADLLAGFLADALGLISGM